MSAANKRAPARLRGGLLLEQIEAKLGVLRGGMTAIDIRTSAQKAERGKDGASVDYVSFRSWEWPQGVGLFGLWRLYEATGDGATLEALHDWFAAMLAQGGGTLRNVNTCAPMQTLVLLEAHDPRPGYREQIESWANWVMNDLPRTPFGGFPHITSNDENTNQLWDDTLFMTVLFLARAGKLLGRRDYLEESLRQFILHDRFLANRQTGLWAHGYGFDGEGNFNDIPWNRGNCWVSIFIPEFLEFADLSAPMREYATSVLRAQLKAMLQLQDPESGFWHTLLDEPSSYLETSGSAGVLYGFLRAIELGLVAPDVRPHLRRATAYLLDQINEDGSIEGVSYGTALRRDREHYRRIPICQNAYGQALAILALVEARRHFGLSSPLE
ncbi:MAG: glycoside hydrolase family 88 protein [Rhodobacteraceae bacterium]|nr:glycoside hydrolase family 88 protein [Paracoccaceae bacterium]